MNLTTGYPYPLISNGLPYPYPKLSASANADVVIIGGGISGALSAYVLTEAGFSCLLVDARTIGLGSTSASTSLLQYEIDVPLYELSKRIGLKNAVKAYELCAEAIDKLEMVSENIECAFFEKQKSLYFSAAKKDEAVINHEFTCRKKAGFDVRLLTRAEIKNEYGFSAGSAILSSKGAITDAYMFTHALLQHSIKKGLRVFDRTPVTNIHYGKKNVTLFTTKGNTIKAKKMITATGYEVLNFVDKKMVKLSSTYAFASENLTEDISILNRKTMVWNTADPYLYMRSTRDNRILVGGRDEPFYNPARRDKLIKRKSNLLLKDFKKLFPKSQLVSEFSWTGTFGTTKDALPYIGTYDKTPHTYYALGFGGNGIVFSMIAAEMIRDMLQGKKSENAHLFAFNR
jgi:glycine/D-amino acid oxidase-like deaminating enzyme